MLLAPARRSCNPKKARQRASLRRRTTLKRRAPSLRLCRRPVSPIPSGPLRTSTHADQSYRTRVASIRRFFAAVHQRPVRSYRAIRKSTTARTSVRCATTAALSVRVLLVLEFTVRKRAGHVLHREISKWLRRSLLARAGGIESLTVFKNRITLRHSRQQLRSVLALAGLTGI